MNYIKNFFKKNYIYLLCFFIPLIIFALSLWIANYRPFGKNLITIYDGFYQYPGIGAYYSNVLKGTQSLLYSFSGSLGTNFYAIAVYYLFNPTSLLLVFFNTSNISIYYELVTILKIGLCGLSISFLLKYLKQNNFSTLLFSIAYALCSYNIVFFSNVMWIDSLFFLPLVIIGLHKLIYENKKLFYLIILSITIISNFYMGYMICIFSLLYFIYNYILINKSERRKGLIKDFIVMSLCAGLISAFALLPVTLELFMGKSRLYTSGWTKYFEFDLDFLYTFYKLTPGSYLYKDISYGTPNIYCTLFVLINVILSFANTGISKKEKILNAAFLLFFLLCFSFNLFDFSWQFFQKPIWYPVRYAFVFNISLILIASKNFIHRDKIKIKVAYKFIIVFILFLLILIGYFLINYEKLKILSKIIGVLLSFLLINEYIFTIDIKNKFLNFFIICLFMLEIVFNTIFSLKNLAVSTTYEYEQLILKNYININNTIKDNDNGFYRMEYSKKYNYNNGHFLNYNGANIFSSVRNNNVIDFFDYYTDTKVGDGCSIDYNFYNPILNALLGMKYLAFDTNAMYYEVAFNDNSSIYINKDAFSLGYLVDENIFNTKLEKENYDLNYNNIVNSMLGRNIDLYEDLDGITENLIIEEKTNNLKSYTPIDFDKKSYLHYNASKKGFYIISKDSYSALEKLIINGEEKENIQTMSTFIFLDDDETMELTFKIYTGMNTKKAKVTFIPYDKYIGFINNIKQNEMQITNYESNHHLTGKVIATTEKNTLFTTIPYDEGWSIYVDGEKIKYSSSLDNAFITFKLNPGEHNIEFKYFPRGLKEGIIISIIGLLTSIIYLYLGKKKSTK